MSTFDLSGQFFLQMAFILGVCRVVGLVLHMFLIGVEFDAGLIRSRLRSAASVSLPGILAPVALGGGLARFLAQDSDLLSVQATLLQTVLFTGAAMSITAFSMLARIIFEQGLSKTLLGTLALAVIRRCSPSW